MEKSTQGIDTTLDLGRRVQEIMKEKGRAYTQQAMANRLGISRETLRLMLNGTDEIWDYQLRRIAEDLKVPVERITQEDVKEDGQELRELFRSTENPHRALEIAKRLVSVAIGLSERSEAFNGLGCAYFDLRDYEKAHDAWLKAYQLAQDLSEQYCDSETLYKVLENLMLSYSQRKEFSHAAEILKKVEVIFKDTPIRMGSIYYTRAEIAENLGDLQSAKDYAYQSLCCFEESGDEILTGRAQYTCANYEFKYKNFSKSAELYDSARHLLTKDTYWKLQSVKGYIKSMLKLNANADVMALIDEALDELQTQSLPELEAKFQLLIARTNREIEYAEMVLNRTALSVKLRSVACVFLMNYYKGIGDSDSLMRYYDISESLGVNDSDILDMEEL